MASVAGCTRLSDARPSHARGPLTLRAAEETWNVFFGSMGMLGRFLLWHLARCSERTAQSLRDHDPFCNITTHERI
jgi:hypothetical protein